MYGSDNVKSSTATKIFVTFISNINLLPYSSVNFKTSVVFSVYSFCIFVPSELAFVHPSGHLTGLLVVIVTITLPYVFPNFPSLFLVNIDAVKSSISSSCPKSQIFNTVTFISS